MQTVISKTPFNFDACLVDAISCFAHAQKQDAWLAKHVYIHLINSACRSIDPAEWFSEHNRDLLIIEEVTAADVSVASSFLSVNQVEQPSNVLLYRY